MGAFQGQGGSGMVRLSQSPWRGSVAFERRQVEGMFPCAERIVSVLANVGGYFPQGKVVFLHYKAKRMCGMIFRHSLLFLSTSTTRSRTQTVSSPFGNSPNPIFSKAHRAATFMVARHYIRIRITPFQSTLIPNSHYMVDSPCVPSRPPF